METMQSSLMPVLEDDICRSSLQQPKGCQESILEDITWEKMIEKLLKIFESDNVNVEEVMDVLGAYNTKSADWRRYAKFDKFKYTRNLVHEGNGKFNLMLLCWTPGNQSSIHDHSDAHCFVKDLDGDLLETRYHWPRESIDDKKEALKEKDRTYIHPNDVTYMSDELGLHRVENISHTEKAVSLHLYSPPFKSCKVFDERTGDNFKAPMTFWSKFGERINTKKSERKYTVTSTAD